MSTETKLDVVDFMSLERRVKYLVYGYMKDTVIPHEIKDLCATFINDHPIKSNNEIERLRELSNKKRVLNIIYLFPYYYMYTIL